ncbi:hypothetical protein LTR86_010814 [Recurvomyces mirabilis]|nr:hypothetical protein LTR86_010814 [Recurvomyces mirabilis]
MPTIQSKYDGASLFYRQYVPQSSAPSFRHLNGDAANHHTRPTLVFSAAWPFSGAMYDHLIPTLTESYRYSCIVPDRRGFGQSEWSGPAGSDNYRIDYGTFAQDLRQIIQDTCQRAGRTNATFVAVGTSMGCGEIIEMLSNDDAGDVTSMCKGIVLICSSLPIPMWTERKPTGPLRAFWDSLLDHLREDADEGLASTLPVIFGPAYDSISPHVKARYERILAQADRVAVERAVQIYLDRDFTTTLEAFGRRNKIPVMILHGTEDRANPVNATVRDALDREVKSWAYIGTGLYQTRKEKCLEDILELLSELS